jgi:RNA polymerase sigma factor (sigma-70 family)
MLALVTSPRDTGALAISDLEPHRRLLWSLCYRMTGVAADADDLVQETFVRALSSPPEDRSRDLAPWLVRVAMNASRDVLRKRKREGYVGPWLPSPIDLESYGAGDQSAPSARLSELESVSYAFMRALEALSVSQRSVLILRDVLDYSVRETAEVLGLSEVNVKTSHHRARAKLEAYEATRPGLDAASLERARGAMTRFFAHIALNDIEGLERLLAGNVEGLNDGAGEFFAATRPIRSPHRLARFFAKIAAKNKLVRAVPCMLSGLPTVIADVVPYRQGVAPRSVNLFETDDEGHIVRVFSIVAPKKIRHLMLE